MSESLFEQYKAALRRGHVAALAGELEDALAAYDEAARLVPDRALPLASRGTVLHRLDRWPEAAEAFDRALQLSPDDEAGLRARATARADRGLRSGAAADFERLAFVLDVAGRAGPAAEAARRAAEIEPTPARTALADRLGAAAATLADLVPPAGATEADGATSDGAASDGATPDDPWGAALDARRLEGLDGDAEATATEAPLDTGPADDASVNELPADGESPTRRPLHDGAAYDALDALRAGLDSEGRGVEAASADAPDGVATAADDAAETAAAERETVAGEVAPAAAEDPATAAEGAAAQVDAEPAADGSWPGIDLPSPPPPPIEGPPPDPEQLLAEATLVLERGEIDAARDLLLTAARVHRDAGRIDAALEICLNLLTIAPGDPRVHLAIANLQLDRGWTGVATEKIDLLVRLTSLTGDTQAEADVHGLASERLRDDPAASAAAR